jgi:hypothetical protein
MEAFMSARVAPETAPVEMPLAELERRLIHEFVRERGYDPDRLDELPGHVRDALLKQASTHASAKLTEVEARSHFVHEIHDRISGASGSGLD